MKFILYVILFLLIFATKNIICGENRLLNLQYISTELELKELSKNYVYSELGKNIISSISAGDIGVDPNDFSKKYMFTLDDDWNRIVYSKKDDDWVKTYGSYGSGNGQFKSPQDLIILNDGTIYVADTYNNRIVKLLFDFNTYNISFVESIDLGEHQPRSVDVSEECGKPIFVATNLNQLLVIFYGIVYKYPQDFANAEYQHAILNYGAFEVDVADPYVYFIDLEYNIIHMLTFNSNVTNINLLFQDYYSYDYNVDLGNIKKLSIHPSFPNNVAYMLFNNSKIRMRILTSNQNDILIPGVEGRSNSEFDNAVAIGLHKDLGDFFIGESWIDSNNDLNWKSYWYAIGPEVQYFSTQNLDYDNINEFGFTLPDLSFITTEIIKPDGSLLKTVTSDADGATNPGKFSETFDEYYQGSYIPYGNYQYRLTAKSAYPHEGASDDPDPVTILSQSFEGGVKPSESDILCSASYIVQGRSYTVKTYSNSGDFNPEPQYADAWRIVYSNGDAVISDISETKSPYKASYRASHITSGALNKVMDDETRLDEVGVKVSFNGLQTSEVTQSYTVNLDNPEVCPILYIGDKPLVNVLPQSDDSERMYTDRITIPSKYLNGDELDINFRENGDDITFFESVELITEDVERGSKIVRTNTGMSFEYNKRKNLINTSLSKKHSSEVMHAGDTLDVVVDQSGDVILAMQGSYLGDPIEFCVVYRNDGQFLSVYQKSSSGDRFIDASYARAMSYESNFFLADTLSEGGSREYYVIFHMDYQLDSLFVYEMSENPNKQLDSQQFIIPTPHIFNILAPQVFKENKLEEEGIPDLKPGERIDLKFKLPPLKEDMARFGYLKIVGRYTPYSITNLLDSGLIPKKYAVYQNFPNPFNPSTTIAFSMPAAGSVKITIYNLLGQKIKELRRQYSSGGYYSLQWHGKNNINRPVSSGIYIYRAEILDAAGKSRFNGVKKMLVLK